MTPSRLTNVLTLSFLTSLPPPSDFYGCIERGHLDPTRPEQIWPFLDAMLRTVGLAAALLGSAVESLW
jgi:hypothetical protein